MWRVDLQSDGIALDGSIRHERGLSTYTYRMDTRPRRSEIRYNGGPIISLEVIDDMYSAALRAFRARVEGDSGDGILSTLADGLAVERILAQVRVTA